MSLIKCKECGKEISQSATKCPNCGKQLEQSPGKIVLGVILLIIGLSTMMNAFNGSSTVNTTSSTSGIALTSDGIQKINSDDFTIIESKTKGTRSKDGTYTVIGQVKQNVEGSYTGITITLNLLDKNGKKVRETTGWISCEYLGNKIWEFEVYGNDADKVVTDYEIAYCYGY